MSKTIHKSYTYLLEDVIKGKFNHAIDPEDLWKLVENKPMQTININIVKHWVYVPCWSRTIDNIDCFYSIYQVINQRSKFRADMRRINNADTKYPIIVVEDDYDLRGGILDGNHRFAKLIISGATHVNYKYVTKAEIMNLMIKL